MLARLRDGLAALGRRRQRKVFGVEVAEDALQPDVEERRKVGVVDAAVAQGGYPPQAPQTRTSAIDAHGSPVLRLDALLPSAGSGAAAVPRPPRYYGGAKTARTLPALLRFLYFLGCAPRGLDFGTPASLRCCPVLSTTKAPSDDKRGSHRAVKLSISPA